MRIIDADSHFHEPVDWLREADPVAYSRMPDVSDLEIYMDIAVGDLFTSLPQTMRPDPISLAPPSLVKWIKKKAELEAQLRRADIPGRNGAAASSDGGERLKWIDERGIDTQLISPTSGYLAYRAARGTGDPRLYLRVAEAYNRWAAERLHGFTDRLIPVMILDLGDVPWCIDEMRRMREKGCRAALVSAEPTDHRSLSHPELEPIWSNAADLGITMVFHVGGGRTAMHAGWGNNGGDAAQLARLMRLHRHQLPELALASLIYGGVLERYPALGILVSELGIDWVPAFLDRIDHIVEHPAEAALIAEPYRLALRPSEYVRRQVRVSVVPKFDRLLPTFERVPQGVLVFASDFPHPEGAHDAVSNYAQELQNLPLACQESYFGASAAQMLGL